jgi:hypothetical protein
MMGPDLDKATSDEGDGAPDVQMVEVIENVLSGVDDQELIMGPMSRRLLAEEIARRVHVLLAGSSRN